MEYKRVRLSNSIDSCCTDVIILQLQELTFYFIQGPSDESDDEEQVSIILHSVAPHVLQVTDAVIEAKIYIAS